MPIATEQLKPVPGMWWSVFGHSAAGTRFFITKEEPVLQLYEGGVFFLVADENFIVTNADGFQLFWKYYCPQEGEAPERIKPEEIKRLGAESSGSDPAQADSGLTPPEPDPTE